MSILPSLLVFSNPFQAIAPSSTTNLAISTASINTSTNDLVHLSSELGPKTMNSRRANETKILVSGRIMTKWIMPRWGNYTLNRISAGEVELWLRSLAFSEIKLREDQKYVIDHLKT